MIPVRQNSIASKLRGVCVLLLLAFWLPPGLANEPAKGQF